MIVEDNRNFCYVPETVPREAPYANAVFTYLTPDEVTIAFLRKPLMTGEEEAKAIAERTSVPSPVVATCAMRLESAVEMAKSILRMNDQIQTLRSRPKGTAD